MSTLRTISSLALLAAILAILVVTAIDGDYRDIVLTLFGFALGVAASLVGLMWLIGSLFGGRTFEGEEIPS